MHPIIRAVQVSSVNAAKAFGRLAQRGWNNRNTAVQYSGEGLFGAMAGLSLANAAHYAFNGNPNSAAVFMFCTVAGVCTAANWRNLRTVSSALRDGPADAARWLYSRASTNLKEIDSPLMPIFAMAGGAMSLAERGPNSTAVTVFALGSVLLGTALTVTAGAQVKTLKAQLEAPTATTPQAARP